MEHEDDGLGMERKLVGGFPGASQNSCLAHKRGGPGVVYPGMSVCLFLFFFFFLTFFFF